MYTRNPSKQDDIRFRYLTNGPYMPLFSYVYPHRDIEMDGDLIQSGLKKEIVNYFAKRTSSWHFLLLFVVSYKLKMFPNELFIFYVDNFEFYY